MKNAAEKLSYECCKFWELSNYHNIRLTANLMIPNTPRKVFPPLGLSGLISITMFFFDEWFFYHACNRLNVWKYFLLSKIRRHDRSLVGTLAVRLFAEPEEDGLLNAVGTARLIPDVQVPEGAVPRPGECNKTIGGAELVTTHSLCATGEVFFFELHSFHKKLKGRKMMECS